MVYYNPQYSNCNLIKTMHIQMKPNPEDNGVITKNFLKRLMKSDFKQYYTTASLNDVLYLHYKGFEKISNLQEYTGLKVLYIEGNSIKNIEGLEQLVNLRCLYMHENLVTKMQGFDTLQNLVNLNLNDNLIEQVSGLSRLAKLQNLQLKRNHIGRGGIEDVIGLLECPSISALDISDNQIDTEDILPEVLVKMPNLAVLYMQNNGFNKKIAHYRKTMINKIPGLKYIDDKPIFEDERRYAEAWARGGIEQQRRERDRYKKQKEQEQLRQHRQFRDMMQRYEQEARKAKQQVKDSSSDHQSESKSSNLSSYNTPEDSQNVSASSRNATEQSDQTSERSVEEKEGSENVKKELCTDLDQLD